MKKISLMLVAALALGFTACSDDDPAPELQKNPQLPEMSADDIVLNASVPSTLELTPLINSADTVNVAQITKLDNLPEGYVANFVLELGRDAEFVRMAELPLTLRANNMLGVSAAKFEEAFVDVFGKSAKPKEAFMRVYCKLVSGTNEVYMNTYYAAQTSTITPLDLGIELEPMYYFAHDARKKNWKQMNHSEMTVDDDPTFSLFFDMKVSDVNSGYNWLIVPQSTYDVAGVVMTTPPAVENSVFGVAEADAEALEGNLIGTAVEDGEITLNPAWGKLTTPGVYRFTVDMENQSYKWDEYLKVIYVGGNNAVSGTTPRMFAQLNSNEYNGIVREPVKYRFLTTTDTESGYYGKSDVEGKLVEGGDFFSGKGKATYMKVNLADLTYTITPVTAVTVVGTNNGWDAAAGAELRGNTAVTTYTGTVTFDAPGEFKFVVNNSWDVSLGGTPDALEFGGMDNNIKVAEAGTYTITLNLASLPYTCTLVKK